MDHQKLQLLSLAFAQTTPLHLSHYSLRSQEVSFLPVSAILKPLRRSTKNAPIASSASLAAASLPTPERKPCVMLSHTSADASTPDSTARSTYRRVSSSKTSSLPT